MDSQTFELISQGLRYWIAGLILFIFIRAARGVRRSFIVEKHMEKQEQGGFSLGVLEVMEAGGSPRLLGNQYVLRQENRLGKGADCDIRIQERSLARIQALIYQRGNKVFLSDYGSKQGVGLNGYRVKEDIALMDGDEIQLSHVVLSLRLQQSYSAKKRSVPEDRLYGEGEGGDVQEAYLLGGEEEPREDEWSSGEGYADSDVETFEDDDDYDYDDDEGEYDEYDPYDPA